MKKIVIERYDRTTGKVTKVCRLWWIKINTKPVRSRPLVGAAFPHIITVKYTVEGKDYTKKKLIRHNRTCPGVGDSVHVFYRESKPARCRIKRIK